MANSTPQVASPTLAGLESLPKTACVGCPNAIWQSVEVKNKESLRVFCLLLHAVMDEMLAKCDGVTWQPQSGASAS